MAFAVETLPEVILPHAARGGRPENTAGAGEFWYEPEVWSLPLAPRPEGPLRGIVLFPGESQINRKVLRNTLKDRTDEEIAEALEDLVRHGLFSPAPRGYKVRSVKGFEG